MENLICILLFLLTEMTARFEMSSPVGQRCILQYMLPWLANIELVDLSNASPTPPELNIETEEEEQTGAMSPVELEGEGWGSVEATQMVLNNLFYITVKVSHPLCLLLKINTVMQLLTPCRFVSSV